MRFKMGRVEEDVDAQAVDLRAAQRRLVKTDAEPMQNRISRSKIANFETEIESGRVAAQWASSCNARHAAALLCTAHRLAQCAAFWRAHDRFRPIRHTARSQCVVWHGSALRAVRHEAARCRPGPASSSSHCTLRSTHCTLHSQRPTWVHINHIRLIATQSYPITNR